MRVFHQNIDHRPLRLDSLKNILEEIKLDLFIITEHNKSWEKDRINLDNFFIASSYSKSNQNHLMP